jgi:hypothetical protein
MKFDKEIKNGIFVLAILWLVTFLHIFMHTMFFPGMIVISTLCAALMAPAIIDELRNWWSRR